MKLYDTLSQKKKEFKPQSKKSVEIFVCGPTVYDHSHIGHARTYIAFDAFVKYLHQKGYNPNYIVNITDIDDRIIERAKENNKKTRDIARRFEKEFYNDMDALNVTSVTSYARASDFIPEIIDQIRILQEKGFAYKIKSGVYFDVEKFKNYGNLSRQKLKDLETGVRIKKEKEKKHPYDFALWKIRTNQNEPVWDSPWGEGRPGWHIEDTAITHKLLGPQYDIHGGARDLLFPHHEAEIAQMESAYGLPPIVNFWMHTGFLNIKGQKMAKSEGNFITIKDFLKKYRPKVLRMFVLSAHYRSPVDYSKASAEEARSSLERLEVFYKSLGAMDKKNEETKNTNSDFLKILRELEKEWEKALKDDFNTPSALAAIFKIVKEGNKRHLTETEARKTKEFFDKANQILEIFTDDTEVPRQVRELMRKREELRKEKKWTEADKTRKKISKMGYTVEDTEKGMRIRKK